MTLNFWLVIGIFLDDKLMICDCWCTETSLESRTENQSDITKNLFCSLNLSLHIQSTIIFEKMPIFTFDTFWDTLNSKIKIHIVKQNLTRSKWKKKLFYQSHKIKLQILIYFGFKVPCSLHTFFFQQTLPRVHDLQCWW